MYPKKLFVFSSYQIVYEMARKRMTNGQKLKILADMDERLARGESLKSIARLHGVVPFQLREWRRNRVKLASVLGKKKSSGRGRTGFLKHLEEPIISCALDQRTRGIPVNYALLVVKACQLSEQFREKTPSQQYHIVRRLAIANCLVDRAITHVSQQHPAETVEKAKEWLISIRPTIHAPNVNKKFVINMDQSPVFMSMHPKRTLDLVGARTINCRKTANSTARVTVSLAVSANGDKLKPMLIFKGKPEGTIARTEIPTFETRNELLLCCQENAWQDEANMRRWIDEILVPYLQEKAQGVPAILFLDHFSVHKSAATMARLAEIGVQLELIPAGCTGLVQPVDVGIGKPFKDRIRKTWMDWMIEQDADQPVMTNASRKDAATWVADAWRNFDPTTVMNAWQKTDFNYF